MPPLRRTSRLQVTEPFVDLQYCLDSSRLMPLIRNGQYVPPREVKILLRMHEHLKDIERSYGKISYHQRKIQKEVFRSMRVRRDFHDSVLESILLAADGPLLDIISAPPPLESEVIDLTDDSPSPPSPSPVVSSIPSTTLPTPPNTPDGPPPGIPVDLRDSSILQLDAPLGQSRRAPAHIVFGPHDTCGHEPAAHHWDLDAASCVQYTCPHCLTIAPGHYPMSCPNLDFSD